MKSKLLTILTSIMLLCLCLFTLTACENGDNGGDTPPAHEHSFTNYVSNNDATCTANGTETAKCDNCDATDTREIENSKLAHSFTSYVSDNNASCTANGTETAKCDNCDATDTREAQDSKLAHSFTSYVSDNNATCTANCTETAKCDNCDATDTREIENSKLAHSFTSYASDNNATCTANGTETAKCDNCDATDTRVAQDSKLAHSFTSYVSDNNATCTANGTETAKCDNCDATDMREVTDSKLAHSFTSYVSDNNATCTANGTETAKCDNCDATDMREVTDSKLAHSFTSYVSNNDATCTANGTETAKCDNCDATDMREVADSKLAHSFTSYVSNNDATCTANGTETAKCDNCDATDTREAQDSKLAHTYDKQVAESKYIKEEATCETKAIYYLSCECGEKGTETFEYGDISHNFTNYVSNNDATCTANCTETAKCDNCDATDTREIENSKLAHTYDKQVAESKYIKEEATCETKAIYYLSCECGEKGAETFEYGDISHSFTNYVSNNDATLDADGTKTAKCDNCDATDTVTDVGSKLIPTDKSAFTFDNGTITGLTDYGKTLTKIIIPKTIDGINVMSIGDQAFRACSSLTSIIIPNSVISIGSRAFYNCSKLTSIEISGSITSMGELALYNCKSLKKVNYLGTIDSWVKIEFGSSSANPIYYAKNLYINNVLVTEAVLTSATKISSYAFYNCYSLTSIVIPDSVTSIGEDAFYGCTSLNYNEKDGLKYLGNSENPYLYLAETTSTSITTATIDSNCRFIGSSVFGGCTSLESITLPFVGASLNGTADTHFGYIFGAGGYSSNNTYVPSSLKTVVITGGESIDKNAFRGCESLTSIVILDNVTSIGKYAFYTCRSLTSIEIPDSVTSIGDYVFNGCPIESATLPTTAISSIPKSKLKEVIITSGESISDYAFSGCELLTSIVIPDSVTSIGYEAFYNCSSLTKVNYLGTIDSWVQIEFDYSSNPIYYAKNLYINDVLVTEAVLTSATKISSYAFYNCDSLTSIVISDSVTSIGGYAFEDCDSLTSVIIGNGVTSIGNSAFYDCDLLTSVTIGNSVTSIGWSAFEDCDSLTSVIIGNGVTSIGNSAFYDCDLLTSVTIGNSVTSISSNAFYSCDSLKSVTIGNSVTSIGDFAFDDCYLLTSIVIPDSVTSIGDFAFDDCYLLTSVTIGNSVTSIGSYAFYGCSSLTKVNYLGTIDSWAQIEFASSYSNPIYYAKNLYINDVLVTNAVLTSATKISDYAFWYCYSLTSIVIPDSVTSIGEDAFEYCYKLVEVINNSPNITVEKGSSSNGYLGYYALSVSNCDSSYVTKVSTDSNGYVIYSDGEDKILVNYVGSQTELTLPSDITKINNYAFYNNDKITSVSIPDSVTSIGDSAFWYCYSLTSIVIPDSVTSIGNYAFLGCYKLVEVINNSPNITVEKGSTDNGCLGYYAVSIFNAGDTYVNRFTTDTSGYVTYIDGDDKILVNYVGSQTELTLPSDITEICKYAFYNNDKITSVVIPDSVTSIGDYAFYNCDSLTSVTIGNGVTSIGSYAFDDCYLLTSVTIGNSVTSIGSYAFYGCSSLTKVNYLGTIDSWAQIEFASSYSNPIYYAKNLYINDVLVTEAVLTSATKISSYAFYNCTSLTSIVIPDSVISIGSSAFYGCDSLTSIVIPDSVTSIGSGAFNNCNSLNYNEKDGLKYLGNSSNPYLYLAETNSTSITTATIDSNCKIIGYGAFEDCESLTSIVIPDSVTSIGSGAFEDCDSLTSIVIPDSVTSIGDYAFNGCSIESATLPTTAISSIPKSKLKEVVITGGESIGYSAFYRCTSLTSVVIPDSVTSIGDQAFYNCSSLTKVNYLGTIDSWAQIEFGISYSNPIRYAKNLYINDVLVTEAVLTSATKISSYAFYGCNSLTSVVIPDSVTSIGDYAFYGCFIESATLPTTAISSIPKSKLKEVIITGGESLDKNAFRGCESLTSIVVPNSVTSMGDLAFYKCTSLTKVNYLGTIDSWAQIEFGSSSSNPIYYAKNLYINDVLVTEAVLTSATKISSYAFYSCTSLTSIVIPDSVTSIGNQAFYECNKLTTIKYRGTEEEWSAISKGSNWDYNTGDYTIIFNYTGD